VLTLLALEQTKQDTLKGDGEKKETETTISTKTTSTTSALNFSSPTSRIPMHITHKAKEGKKDAKEKMG
jgi:hypothetical protein